MKRLLLGLLVVVLFCGVAFAADFETGKHTKKSPSKSSFQSQFENAEVLDVIGLGEIVVEGKDFINEKLDKPGEGGGNQLKAILQELKNIGYKASISYVTFKFNSGTAKYKWSDDDESLFNFKEGVFYYNDEGTPTPIIPVTPYAVLDITLDGSTDYEDLNPPTGADSAIISLKADKDDGGGCSAIQLGAIALFLLPAFALLRRSKK